MDKQSFDGDHILLVEDDPNDVELTLSALEQNKFGKRVIVVRDGAEALDFLFRHGRYEGRKGPEPLVVLLDNKMPKVSGLEVLKIIKADARLKRIPMVALTSSREIPDLVQFYEHGVNAYVVKPVDLEEFMRAIGQLGIFWTTVNEPPTPVS